MDDVTVLNYDDEPVSYTHLDVYKSQVLLSSETYIRCQVTEGVSGNAEEPGGNTA